MVALLRHGTGVEQLPLRMKKLSQKQVGFLRELGGEEFFQRKVGFLKERRAVSERMVFSKKKGQSLRKKAFSEKELCFLRKGKFLREMRAFSEKE